MELKTLIATNAPVGQPQLKMRSMPTNEAENKCLSSAHRRNSGTNMHRAKTLATRGEQPGTYQCAAPMLCMLQAHCLRLVQRCTLRAAALRTQC